MMEQKYPQAATTMKKPLWLLIRRREILLFLVLMSSSLFAQEKPAATTPINGRFGSENALPRYDLQIENGVLLLKGLKDRIDVRSTFKLAAGGGEPVGMQANLRVIVDLLRELHHHSDIVMAPDVGEIRIGDLRLRSIEEPDVIQLPRVLEALRVASGGKFIWRQDVSPDSADPTTGFNRRLTPLYFLDASEVPAKSNRNLEVFNMSGYVRQLDLQDDAQVKTNIENIVRLIGRTFDRLKRQEATHPDDFAEFDFHSGANVLVAIGPPDALEVARKVVFALPGQQGSPEARRGGGSGGFGTGGGSSQPTMPREQPAPPPKTRP